MIRLMVTGYFLICLTTPVWATEVERFEPDQPFDQALATNLFRSLLNQALERLEDHVEMSGNLNPDPTKGDRRGHLQFKFYPEGKSKSDQHFSAEGWFHFSPEVGERDWHFKFKLPEDRHKLPPSRFETPL